MPIFIFNIVVTFFRAIFRLNMPFLLLSSPISAFYNDQFSLENVNFGSGISIFVIAVSLGCAYFELLRFAC